MAPTLQLTRTNSPRTLLTTWHLLSLDAPTVAALWTFFIARSTHTPVPTTSIAAMFLAVWILYAADRLLDARHLDSHSPDTPHLEARHLFHHRHRHLFRLGILLASLALAPLLLTIPPATIRLYLIAGTLLIAWFLLIHAAPSSHRLPKEFAVGAFFAAATFIPTVARNPSLRQHLIFPALLFAALCSLNCLFVYRWEHPAPLQEACHPTTRLALRHLTLIPLLLAAAALLLHTPLTIAVAFSALLLLTLHRTQTLSRTTLRAAADLALLTPVLILPFLQ